MSVDMTNRIAIRSSLDLAPNDRRSGLRNFGSRPRKPGRLGTPQTLQPWSTRCRPAGDDQRALDIRTPCLLDRRQRLLAPRPEAVQRLQRRWPNLVHLPVHASWLNQIEIYFSIAQRKVLEPNDFQDIAHLARTLNAFEHRWNEVAEPFEWNFTGDDLVGVQVVFDPTFVSWSWLPLPKQAARRPKGVRTRIPYGDSTRFDKGTRRGPSAVSRESTHAIVGRSPKRSPESRLRPEGERAFRLGVPRQHLPRG